MEENKIEKQEKLEKIPEKKPNENLGFHFSSHIKIFDPNTNEVLVKQRGDN